MSTTKQSSFNANTNESKNSFEKNGVNLKSRVGVGHGDRNVSCSVFSDFQQSVDDAWDAGDDEICALSSTSAAAAVGISASLASETALSVLNSHQSAQSSTNRSNECSDSGKAEAMRRLAAQKPLTVDVANFSGCSSLLTTVSQDSGHRLPVPSTPSLPLLPPVRYLKQKANSDCSQETVRLQKLRALLLLSTEAPSLSELRRLSWHGIPQSLRAAAWRVLSGYVPLAPDRRQAVLQRRRHEYWSFVDQYYETRHEVVHQDTYRQIHIDIPRMSPLIPLFQQRCVQEMFERILYIWAIRHPASGYVQGMNDLVTPFFIVFLQEVLSPDCDLDGCQLLTVDQHQRQCVEADSFWALSALLDRIQDNYTFAQPGIQTKVAQLKCLVQRIDAPLYSHIERHGIDFLQFSFRWMNNLLMRELPLHCTIRLWDSYLAEEDGFAVFHLYVCAAFLTFWSRQLMQQTDFQGLMLTLQNLPTHDWSGSEVTLLVAEAFRLKYTFADAPSHLPASLNR